MSKKEKETEKAPESATQAKEIAHTIVDPGHSQAIGDPTHQHSVAVQKPGSVPTAIAGLDLDDLAADQGGGVSNVTATDLSTPIISVLQANSPQCKRSDGKYIEGAKEGDLYNNVTNEVYSGEDGLTIIPCYFEKVFVEWKPNRGGLAGVHPVNTSLREQVKMVKNAEGKDVPTLPNGNNLIETNQHYVLIVRPNEAPEGAVISMASSQLRSSRLLNTLIKKVQLQDSKGNFFTPASYYMQYKLTTQAKTKDQYSWFVWAVESAGPVQSKAYYDAGKALEKAVAGGKIKVKIDESAHDGGSPEGQGSDVETPIPF